MRISLDGAGSTLRLDFDSDETLGTFAADWLTNEGCLVQLSEPMKLWTGLTVELRREGAARVVVGARVVQVFGGDAGGYATALEATDAGPLDAFSSDSPAIDEPADEPPHREADRAGCEMLGASPVFRIREMNVGQKMHLAPRATLSERQILLRDTSPQVLMGLLANPRIEDKEVLVLAKSPTASGGVLQRIAKDRRWSTNYEVRLALVKNPHTPTPLARQMLESLRERDLRTLAKGANVREAIRAAALRRVVKR